MMLTDEVKKRIDAMTYEQLLGGWRHAPVGDPMFQGASCIYWSERMKELRAAGADHVGASKRVGWRVRR